MKTSHKLLLGLFGGGGLVLDAPTITAPIGIISDTTPDIEFTLPDGATNATVRVYDGSMTLVFEDTEATSPVTVSPALDPTDGPFTVQVFANPNGAIASETFDYTPVSYLQGLGALLIFDGTLTEDETPKIANLGSVGSAIDGTPTAITVNENGMVFNGDTSKIVVPQHASLTSMDAQEWVIVGREATAGEGSSGAAFRWGVGTTRASHVNTGANLLWALDYNTTDALVSPLTPSVAERVYFYSHDAATNTPAIRYGEGGNIVTPTQTPTVGVGTIVVPSTDLIIGNNSIDTQGWDGYMRLFAVFNRVLTTQERSNIAAFFS